MKKIFFLTIALALITLTAEVKSQTIVTTVGDYEIVIGDTVKVPISATNFFNIASVSLAMKYDTSKLIYVGYENINPAMMYGTFIVGNNKAEIRIAWFSLFPGSFADDTIIDIVFTCKNLGTSGLDWDTLSSGNCEFTGINGIPLDAYFESGGITIIPPDLGFRGKVFLQGAYQGNGVMNTTLNGLSGFPLSQPFNTSPWNYAGTEQIDSVTSTLVDWILIEVRDSSDATTIVERRAVLLLADGTIADTNFVDEVSLQSKGNYYIAIRHANHIPLMTTAPLMLPDGNSYDFSDTTNFPTYVTTTHCVISLGDTTVGMIAGDVNQDGKLKYSGPSNDKGLILQKIVTETGSSSITTTANGYFSEDVNMNGQLKYSGPSNDPSRILQNIVNLTGSSSITTVFSGPVPTPIIP